MYFHYGGLIDGGDVTPGANQPARTSYFGEGHQGDGFDTYLVVMNPSDHDAEVTAAVGTATGTVDHRWSIPAYQRSTVRMSDLGVSGDLFLSIASSVPVVAERSTYFDADIPGVGRVSGGHVAVGSAQGSTAWYFSEGHTGDGFHQYLVLANPGSTV